MSESEQIQVNPADTFRQMLLECYEHEMANGYGYGNTSNWLNGRPRSFEDFVLSRLSDSQSAIHAAHGLLFSQWSNPTPSLFAIREAVDILARANILP